jgi:hypothetical protein
MAAVAFDPLEYARRLEAAGMPRVQAEIVAKCLTAMFIHNFDTLVTKDYLDIRFSEFEARIDLRFADMETRFARVNVMLGVILAALAIPVLQTVLLWVR